MQENVVSLIQYGIVRMIGQVVFARGRGPAAPMFTASV